VRSHSRPKPPTAKRTKKPPPSKLSWPKNRPIRIGSRYSSRATTGPRHPWTNGTGQSTAVG